MPVLVSLLILLVIRMKLGRIFGKMFRRRLKLSSLTLIGDWLKADV